MWTTNAEFSLSSTSLQRLFGNEIPLIRIPQFAGLDECNGLVERASAIGFGDYQNVTPKIERLGLTVFEYYRAGKEQYFQAVNSATQYQNRILGGFNPLQRIMQLLQKTTGRVVRIASEPSYGEYFAGLTRKIEQGTQLHIDFAPNEQPGWEVSNVISQLSWNLYLKVSCNSHGKTHIYDCPWCPKDEQYKLDSYGYDDQVLAGANATSFRPQVGDVVIFNTKNYHTVEPTQGHRIMFTSALGLLPSGDIIFWS